MKDFQLAIAGLEDALRGNWDEEPEHARALREANARQGFASDVLATWEEQQLHRGHRASYGLLAEHAEYARSVYAWAAYEAAVARWLHVDANREALRMLNELGGHALSPDDLEVVNARPAPPQNQRHPNACVKPPHWPDDETRSDALGEFFAALQRENPPTP